MKVTAALDALGALAQESRLQVFRLLVQRGPEGLPAGEIAGRLDIPPATLSFHLGQLGQAGLVLSKRNGRSIIYSADFEGMERLMGFLYENCCQGQTCAPAGPGGRKRKNEEP
jgi:ArsR family transcriptional regulator, arsenate/arsenite/antimonite-responsive transcriptional repressor